MTARYDHIGTGYAGTRREDPDLRRRLTVGNEQQRCQRGSDVDDPHGRVPSIPDDDNGYRGNSFV